MVSRCARRRNSASLHVGDGGSRELTGATRAGLTAVRLAAPDLADHLVFDADVDWTGPTVTSLSALPDEVLPGTGATGAGAAGWSG